MAKGEINNPEIHLKQNELLLPTGEHTEDGEPILAKKIIEPTKIRYMVNKDFFGYQVIERVGTFEIFGYGEEGIDIVKRFLSSIFNNEEYVNLIIGDLDVEILENIIKIVKFVNHIKEEDQLKNVMTNQEEV